MYACTRHIYNQKKHDPRQKKKKQKHLFLKFAIIQEKEKNILTEITVQEIKAAQ